tara:strand:- start:941 stop:1141 length:201 start_codon:yes stop_codon:yes gene_type:complete
MFSNNAKKITSSFEKQCQYCKGFGLVKYEPINCKYCNGKKCMYCNSSGLEKMPWDRCEKCFGSGTI